MIVPLTEEYLQDVVNLHYKILNWSINSRLGKEHISHLYKAIINDGFCFGFVFLQHNEVIGIITGTRNWKISQQILFGNYKFIDYVKLFFICLKKPIDFIDISENIFLLPSVQSKLGTSSQALSFITDQSNSFAPIAAVKLYNHFKKNLKDSGENSFFAQVAKYDKRPNDFYISGKAKLIKSYIRNNIYLINL